MNITHRLFALQETNFKAFNASLIPNIDKDTVIGVKTPQLKMLAKELINSGEAWGFIKELPHCYFE